MRALYLRPSAHLIQIMTFGVDRFGLAVGAVQASDFGLRAFFAGEAFAFAAVVSIHAFIVYACHGCHTPDVLIPECAEGVAEAFDHRFSPKTLVLAFISAQTAKKRKNRRIYGYFSSRASAGSMMGIPSRIG